MTPNDVPEDPPGLLVWLQGWYTSLCDGDWEHDEGIEISTLDNPGWRLRIRLVETAWEAKPFDPIKVERDEHDWVHAWVEEGVNGQVVVPAGGQVKVPTLRVVQ